MTLIKEDLRLVLRNFKGFKSIPSYSQSYAELIQTFREDMADVFKPEDPMRQTFRRVIRWAKENTTADVEKAIKEALL